MNTYKSYQAFALSVLMLTIPTWVSAQEQSASVTDTANWSTLIGGVSAPTNAPLTLTLTSDTVLTIDGVATVPSITVNGDFTLTFAGANKLKATTINANTNIVDTTATLDLTVATAITIADGKTVAYTTDGTIFTRPTVTVSATAEKGTFNLIATITQAEALVATESTFFTDLAWRSTLTLSGDKHQLNLRTYGNADSTIELKGVTGYLSSTGYTTLSHIILTDDSTTSPASPAWLLDDGYGTQNYTFEGSLSGSGTLKSSNGIVDGYHFRGEIEDFSGGIDLEAGRRVFFSAQTLTNDTNNTVVVGADRVLTIGAGKKFVVDNLTVDGTLTLNGPTDNTQERIVDSSISGTGNLAIASGKVKLTGSNTYTGTATVNGGTLIFATPSTTSAVNLTSATSTVDFGQSRMTLESIVSGATIAFTRTIGEAGKVMLNTSLLTLPDGVNVVINGYTGEINTSIADGVLTITPVIPTVPTLVEVSGDVNWNELIPGTSESDPASAPLGNPLVLTLTSNTTLTLDGEAYVSSFTVKNDATGGDFTLTLAGTKKLTTPTIIANTNIGAATATLDLREQTTLEIAEGKTIAYTSDGTAFIRPTVIAVDEATEKGTFNLVMDVSLAKTFITADTDFFTGEVWTGTLTLSGSDSSIDARILGNANSTVEFKGVTGWLGGSNHTHTYHVILTDTEATKALSLNNGSARNWHTFSGSFSGTGTLRLMGSITESIYFVGDITNFRGGIEFETNSRRLMFCEPKTNYVALSGNGRMTVEAGRNLTIGADKIFKAEVSPVINGTLTFNGPTDAVRDVASLITGSGNLAIASGNVKLTRDNTYTGTTTVNGGTLVASSISSLSSTRAIIVDTGATLRLDSMTGTLSRDIALGGDMIINATEGSLIFGGAITHTTGEVAITGEAGTVDFGLSRMKLKSLTAGPIIIFTPTGAEMLANTVVLPTSLPDGSLPVGVIVKINGYEGNITISIADGSLTITTEISQVQVDNVLGSVSWNTLIPSTDEGGSASAPLSTNSLVLTLTGDTTLTLDGVASVPSITVNNGIDVGTGSIGDFTLTLVGANKLTTQNIIANANISATSATLDIPSVMEIATGKTVTFEVVSDGVTFERPTVTGAGTFNLKMTAARANAFVAVASSSTFFTDAAWTGTLTLSGTASNHVIDGTKQLALSKLGNVTSTVELKGVSGYLVNPKVAPFTSDTEHITTNIVLTDDVDENGVKVNALHINQGWSNAIFHFQGKLSGTGTLKLAGEQTENYYFVGDITNFAGSIDLTGVRRIAFSESIAAYPSLTNGRLIVGTNRALTIGADRVFVATSVVLDGILTLNGPTDASVREIATVISGSGNLAIASGNVRLTGTNTYTGTTLINGGTLEWANATFTTSSIEVADGGTLNITTNTLNMTQSGQKIMAMGSGEVQLPTTLNIDFAERDLGAETPITLIANVDTFEGKTLTFSNVPIGVILDYPETGSGNVTATFSVSIVVQIKNVTALQRYPWNGLVDITFETECSDPTQEITVTVSATANSLPLTVERLQGDLTALAGKHHLVWDAGIDAPNIQSKDLVITMSASIVSQYLVIDLSGGVAAESYPVAELSAIPEGGWTMDHKTNKLVLRRIEAGTFNMGSPGDELGRYDNEDFHQVTLTKPYYMGVFEVTQKQWTLVMGSISSAYRGDARPVERISYDDIRGNFLGRQWPNSAEVDSTSFMGVLRAKTARDFDLPTEAQWEYVCRAGTTTALNSGKTLTGTTDCVNMNMVGRYLHNQANEVGGYPSNHTTVGSYLPNAWGLYDMHGNVWEWCLDGGGRGTMSDALGTTPVTDPVGVDLSSPFGVLRLRRGGGWRDEALDSRSANRNANTLSAIKGDDYGLRVTVPTVDSPVVVALSPACALDTQVGSRTLTKDEVITYSTQWSSPAAACTVSVEAPDGLITVLKTAPLPESGTVIWQPDLLKLGIYTLTHTAGSDILTATFNNASPYPEWITPSHVDRYIAWTNGKDLAGYDTATLQKAFLLNVAPNEELTLKIANLTVNADETISLTMNKSQVNGQFYLKATNNLQAWPDRVFDPINVDNITPPEGTRFFRIELDF